jgi:hypothetical protein
MVPTCASDAQRLARGEAPKMRLVRVGDRYVPMVLADDESSWFNSVDHRAAVERSRDARGDAQLWGMTDNQGGFGSPFI